MTTTTTPSPVAGHVLTPLDAAHLPNTTIPTRVRIAPWGAVESANGQFTVDDESALLVTQQFEAHGTDLPIDYEHQTLGGPYASPNGQAPAAGWIKRIESEPGKGLFAIVEWTEPAREQLASKQYRYLSPVAVVRKEDQKLIALHSVALTNKPAIVNAEPIVNRIQVTDLNAPTAALSALRAQLGLDDSTDDETILVTAKHCLDRFENESRKQAADQKVQQAILKGQLTEAQRDVAIELALSDAKLFDRWLNTAPIIITRGRTTAPSTATGDPSNAIAIHARTEYRSNPMLMGLTTEQAYVACAINEFQTRKGN